jgi:hypothetical protein
VIFDKVIFGEVIFDEVIFDKVIFDKVAYNPLLRIVKDFFSAAQINLSTQAFPFGYQLRFVPDSKSIRERQNTYDSNFW